MDEMYVIYESDEGKFGFLCFCGFDSSNWRIEEHAQLRAEQHLEEHQTGEPMCNLKEFYKLIGEQY